jgi:signal recognition particle receptor subunit beta
MAVLNEVSGDLLVKIVYAGIPGSGKTTNLQSLYKQMSTDLNSRFFDLHGLAMRHPYFDFLPLITNQVRSQTIRLHLYTLPATPLWSALSRQILQGVDGLVWVVDSRSENLELNENHLNVLSEQLADVGLALGDMATVVQFNHRDSERAASISAMKAAFQLRGAVQTESVAVQDIGVLETVHAIGELILGRMDSVPVAATKAPQRERHSGSELTP